MTEGEDTALDILMSILMASVSKPQGITKTDILMILSSYNQAALYDLAEATEQAENEETTQADLGPPPMASS